MGLLVEVAGALLEATVVGVAVGVAGALLGTEVLMGT